MHRDLDPPEFVDTPSGFAALIAGIEGAERLAVDTEADTMHAYRSRVCLIQVSTAERDYVVDSLAPIDLGPLFAVFADRAVTKVFHDVEFDLLQLKRLHGVELLGIFDTKVAAAALGEPALGLAGVVERHLGVKLDKRYQRSDWARRPLAPGQLEYARRDTHYLLPLADILEAMIDAREPTVRLEIESELERLETLDVRPGYDVDPHGFRRIKGAAKLSPRKTRVLRALWLWREEEAERRDLPPFKVIGHAALLAIARREPRARAHFAEIEALSPKLADRYARSMLTAISRAADLPRLPPEAVSSRTRAGALDEDELARYERLRAWRKATAAARPTDPALVLNREVMALLARLDPVPSSCAELAATKLLESWRVEAYGHEILAALAGEDASS